MLTPATVSASAARGHGSPDGGPPAGEAAAPGSVWIRFYHAAWRTLGG